MSPANGNATPFPNGAVRGIVNGGPAVLDELAAANRPAPFGLLEHALGVLSASPVVTDLLVRGSFARGTADRLSDVDFVVGVADDRFIDFAAVRDALATTALGAILPGWPDTIVQRMGGLGYVYLVEHDGALHQLDLYLAPTSRIGRVAQATRARPLLHRDNPHTAGADAGGDPRAAAFVVEDLARPATCTELLVEILVLGQMIRKRLARGQQFIAYAENHMLNTAVKNLVKTALAPASAFYGWYQLPDEIGLTPIGRACLRDLAALIAAPAVPTVDTLADALHRVVALAERAAPEEVAPLRPAIDAYWHYLELA